MLSDRQLEVWNILKGKCLGAKEIGNLMDLSPENIRKHIQAIRKKYGEKSVQNTRSQGYWRPDQPPSEFID
jgi:DNA-binding CsgD family transcriptional regulator